MFTAQPIIILCSLIYLSDPKIEVTEIVEMRANCTQPDRLSKVHVQYNVKKRIFFVNLRRKSIVNCSRGQGTYLFSVPRKHQAYAYARWPEIIILRFALVPIEDQHKYVTHLFSRNEVFHHCAIASVLRLKIVHFK